MLLLFPHCNEYHDVDVRFNLQLDDNVTGKTDDNYSNVPTAGANSGKKITMKTMFEIANSSQENAFEMKETNSLSRETNDTAKLAMKMAQTKQLIQMAQVFGRTDA